MNEIIEVKSADMLEAINRSEVDVQIATAHRFPRDVEAAKNRIQALACSSKDIAYNCFYHLEREDKQGQGGKSTIEGISVRLAEIIASSWGNLRVQARIIGNDGSFITAQGVCHDLETNYAASVEVRRSIKGKFGTYSQDMQVLTGNAACAIAFRNAVGKVVPGVVISDIIKEIQKKSLEQIKQRGIPEQWKDCVAAFKPLGVGEVHLLSYINKQNRDEVTAEDIQTLGGVYNAINEGTTTADECLVKPWKQKQQEKEEAKGKDEAKNKVKDAMNRSTK